MDIQARKIELVKLLLQTKEVTILEQIRELFNFDKSYELLDKQLNILNVRVEACEQGEAKFSTLENAQSNLTK
jgi:hypothetical protein